jgi:hypothetical protein
MTIAAELPDGIEELKLFKQAVTAHPAIESAGRSGAAAAE